MASSTSSTPVPAGALVVTPTRGELGFSGTANFYGQLAVEANPALAHQLAYGVSGTREWGEWEKIRRTDPAVAMALDFVMGPIRDATMTVKPADDSPVAQAQADFVAHVLGELMAPTWAALLDELGRGSLGTGFALHELVWADARHETLPGGGGYAVTRLAQRLPSSLPTNCWLEDAQGRLTAVRQSAVKTGSWRTTEIPESKLLLTSWQREGDNYAGFSQFRPVWYECKMRDEISRIPGIALAREGAGIPIAYATDPNATLTVEETETLQEALRNLVFHESAHMVMKPGWDLKWVFSGGASKSHVVEVLNHYARNILGVCHAQQMFLGTEETGSRAVGTVHDKRAELFIQGVIANILDTLNGVGDRPASGLVRRMVDANWGPQVAYPKVQLALKPAEVDANTLTQTVAVGVKSGVLTWRLDDENALRARLGLSAVTPEEAGDGREGVVAADGTGTMGVSSKQDTALNGAQVAAAVDIVARVQRGELSRAGGVAMLINFFNLAPEKAEAIMGPEAFEPEPSMEEKALAKAAPVGPPMPPAEAEAADEENGPPLRQSDAWAPSRRLRPSEMVLNLARMAKYLDDARVDFERRTRPLLVAALAEALPFVTEAMADGNPDEVAQTPLRLAPFEAAVRRFLGEAWGEGADEVREELKRPATPVMRNAATDDDGTPAGLGADARKAFDANVKALVRRTRTRLLAHLEDEAIDVVRLGGAAADVVTRVTTKALEGKALQADAGAVLTRVWNAGREETARALGGVAEVELSAALDKATCGPCRDLDGTRYPFNSASHDAHVPPLKQCDGGASCRCLLLYVPSEGGGQ